jgi:hypothetical protein
LIEGAYASCPSAREHLLRLAPALPTTVNPALFFQ